MPTPTLSRNALIQALLVVGLAILALALFQQQDSLKALRAENEKLARENQALQQAPAPAGEAAATQADSETPATPLPVPETPAETAPEVPAVPAERPTVPTITGFAPEPRTSGLQLDGTSVAPVSGGLQATMRFNPTITDPLGVIAVVVRLPRESTSRILELTPAQKEKFKDISQKVSDDGKFAIFHGTMDTAEAIDLTLSVSESAVADVRGTCGIGPFDLNVGPSGATATPKQ
jgi:hypothetical protein